MQERTVAGSCLCGEVAFEVRGPIHGLWCCHCSKCRKKSGAAFQTAGVCKREVFHWLRGEDATTEYRMDSGYRSKFCCHCGSALPLHLEDSPFVWLPAGVLDDDPEVRPRHHIFVASKAPWFEIHDDLPQYDDFAPGT